MFVCSALAAKLLDGSQPNLAWTSPWTLWVISKNFFGLTPKGGTILKKLKIAPFWVHFAAPFAAPFAQLLENRKGGIEINCIFAAFLWEIWILFNGLGAAEESKASQRVSQPTGAKQPTTSLYSPGHLNVHNP